MGSEIWTWLHLADEGPNSADLRLIAEARRLADESESGLVTVVAAGSDVNHLLSQLGKYGADGVIHLQSPHLSHFNGEFFAGVMADLLSPFTPDAMLFAHRSDTAEIAARTGAALERPVMTRAVDIHIDEQGRINTIRPISNGYLFESIETAQPEAALVTLLPDILPDPEPVAKAPLDIKEVGATLDPETLVMKTVRTQDADPETLALEEADIVVAAGRGAGKGRGFTAVQRLAHAIGGSVGGTRPVIDEHMLPFERQIGQTGKTVAPRLIVNCGISGANEYTAGMEKSQLVIAVNTDPRARIFRFADLGIVGDVSTVLPLLADRLQVIIREEEKRIKTMKSLKNGHPPD